MENTRRSRYSKSFRVNFALIVSVVSYSIPVVMAYYFLVILIGNGTSEYLKGLHLGLSILGVFPYVKYMSRHVYRNFDMYMTDDDED